MLDNKETSSVARRMQNDPEVVFLWQAYNHPYASGRARGRKTVHMPDPAFTRTATQVCGVGETKVSPPEDPQVQAVREKEILLILL